MNIGYRWLRALAPGLGATPEEVAETLTMRGAPVEDLVHLDRGLDGIVIGRVEAVRPHPNADRLSLCDVEAGAGVVQVVCGAPNVKAGAHYPFAPVGAGLPGGLTIRKAKIRGESSVGMLCSEKELGLGRDAGGIMELAGEWTPGEPLVDALGLDDVRLVVEVTANRGDLLSHVGVAREVAPGGVAGIALPEIPGAKEAAKAASGVRFAAAEEAAASKAGSVPVRIDDPDLCSRYAGVVIRGVRVGPSPAWLASRLRSVGARPINNVVDATNYVLLELGHPLHAFDVGKLAGPEIVVRRARAGEEIRTLDGVDRALSSDMLAICDRERPVAVAGVMGGEESEVSAETRDVLLECALFDPASTRATRRSLGLSTDASYRFERGVDPEGVEVAVRRAVELILATAGGEVERAASDACPRPFERARVPLRPARVERVLGVPFTAADLAEKLEPLGFEIADAEGDERPLLVSVPGFRSFDVHREVDLIEEIARVHGYDRFPDELGAFRPGTVPDDSLFRLQDELRELLAGRGFLEAQTPAFAPDGEGDVEVLNPVSAEERFLRRSLLPGLFRRVEHNFARRARDVRLFESGTVFAPPAAKGEPPREETRVAVVVTGSREPPHWATPDVPVDPWEVKGLLEALARRAWSDGARVEPAGGGGAAAAVPGDPTAPFDPSVVFTLLDREGEVLGRGGRIASGVVDAPAWAEDVWGIELRLPEEPGAPPAPLFRPLPAFPGIARDLALIVPDGVTAGAVTEVIRARGGALLERVEAFDLYRGEGIPEGTRSVAFRLHFRSTERTLSDADVEPAMADVERALREEPGVESRGH